jgi:phospho-N-acetylmuramoyl-pentapeptide-transferase
MNLNEAILIPELAKLGMFVFGGFVVSMLLTPIYTHFAYKYKWWKKARDAAWIGGGKDKAPVYYKLHAEKHKRNIPNSAGIVIWLSVAIITLLFNFSRSQTWLPLFTLVVMGLLGLIDDYVNISGKEAMGGVKSRLKVIWTVLAAVVGAWWFYSKLGWTEIHVPAVGNFEIGWLYIPFFILVVLATANSVNITDGMDGLSGGLSIFAFGAFAVIALFSGDPGIAAFCLTVVGALITYTWFNIYPARFHMGDTGAPALGATLGVVALLTNSALVLPIVGAMFVFETSSVIIQLTSKKLRKGKKVFLSAPIHYHFQAKGWPESKVTQRFWLIGMIAAVIGVITGILGRG